MTLPAASARVVGYLGPRGTFTEAALHTQPDLAALELRALGSIPDVLAAVSDGEVDVGFVAIENAIEGSVNVTTDTLAFETDLLIQREVTMRVSLNLLARPGVSLSDITRVVSIPVATAQCRHFLRDKLPEARIDAANSTAEAAELIARSKSTHVAAIAPARSADVYGLEILAEEIEDHPENKTRFVAVARHGIPAPTGHDKTSIVVFQRADAPGSLLAILQEFAARSINLTRLESRPTKRSLGDYCFLIDLEGHIADELVADALRSLHAKQARVKFLGSYPAAGDHGPSVRREVRKRWKEAAAWVEELRAQIAR
ncbi:MAG TPA: prephenate dehydratase [Acidimicrobiales bacterium]